MPPRHLPADTPPFAPQGAVRIRRVAQLIADLTGTPFDQLTTLDIACGLGTFSLELALQGARAHMMDGRIERMQQAVDLGARVGLENLTHEVRDVRTLSADRDGQYDVILFLGIQYHLEAAAAYDALKTVYAMTRRLAVVDTHTVDKATAWAELGGRRYGGQHIREHPENATPEVKHSRLGHSLDNMFAFHFTPPELVNLLVDIGFTSVFTVAGPDDPYQPEGRVMFVAMKGTRVELATVPWLNVATREEAAAVLPPPIADPTVLGGVGVAGRGKVRPRRSIVGRVLRRLRRAR